MMSSVTHLDQCLSSEIVMMTENIHKYLQGIVFLHIQFFTTCLAFLPDNNHKPFMVPEFVFIFSVNGTKTVRTTSVSKK